MADLAGIYSDLVSLQGQALRILDELAAVDPRDDTGTIHFAYRLVEAAEAAATVVHAADLKQEIAEQ